MRLVPGGPDIPNSILKVQQEGRLVLICGAGISKPNGLPLFDELVDRVSETLGPLGPAAQKAYEAELYDRVFRHLELKYGADQVRSTVQNELAVPSNPDVTTHQALLDLGTTLDGNLHLVTTNFDLLFEEADPDLHCAAAPALPVPKREKWNDLVYLHGRIDSSRDPNGQNLVLSSADFGTAYLLERWASRFICELFTHFTVVFVGYSVNDPVMRYLVDALAAERKAGRPFREAYAFVACDGDDQQTDIIDQWRSKHVIPLLYDAGNNHASLHQTLSAWADLWRGGLTSKKNVALDLGKKDPSGLSGEEKSKFLWALKDEDVAGHFADQGRHNSIEWLHTLDDEGLLGLAGATSDEVPLAGYSLEVNKPSELNPITRQLGRWLAKFIDSHELMKWVISKGGQLHPEFANQIRRELEKSVTEADTDAGVCPPAMVQVWRALLAPDVVSEGGSSFDQEMFSLDQRLRTEHWTPSLRTALLNALSPRLLLRKHVSFPFEEGVPQIDDTDYESGQGNQTSETSGKEGEEDSEEEAANGSGTESRGSESPRPQSSDSPESEDIDVSDIVWVDCATRAGSWTQNIVEAVNERDDRDAILADIGLDLTIHLRKALDFLAMLDQANQHYDPSTTEHPSIAPHAQNNHINSWTWLITLARDSFDALQEHNPGQAKQLLQFWDSIPYPLFRRLTLYGAKKLLEAK